MFQSRLAMTLLELPRTSPKTVPWKSLARVVRNAVTGKMEIDCLLPPYERLHFAQLPAPAPLPEVKVVNRKNVLRAPSWTWYPGSPQTPPVRWSENPATAPPWQTGFDAEVAVVDCLDERD